MRQTADLEAAHPFLILSRRYDRGAGFRRRDATTSSTALFDLQGLLAFGVWYLTVLEERTKAGCLLGCDRQEGVSVEPIARQHGKPDSRLGANPCVLSALEAAPGWVQNGARA